jgi:anthranilate/para-aminobenzoate synthase component I
MLQNSSTQSLAELSASSEDDFTSNTSWVPLSLTLSPAEMAAQLADREGFIWLDSATSESGCCSYLTAKPTLLLSGHMDQDWPKVVDALENGQSKGTSGGLFGWVHFDGAFLIGQYPAILKFDHATNTWFENGPFDLPHSSFISPPTSVACLAFEPLLSREEFVSRVKAAQRYISAGDIYQVNLSYPWLAHWPNDASILPLYKRLREISPAPYAACLNLAGTTIFSASPELFLKMSGRHITTRPIKGTRPRFADDLHRDAQSARDLLACDKERAELLMITDLERNDLGQICEFGSVQTPDLWRVECFAQVYHLVSTVTGTLRPQINHAAAFRACFPGGSISGAPKKRALEIITELETHPRGLYTGAIGYFGFDGISQWNIAIRTAIKHHDLISFHVGSGIVADSIPEREWEETLHKASGLLKAWS